MIPVDGQVVVVTVNTITITIMLPSNDLVLQMLIFPLQIVPFAVVLAPHQRKAIIKD